MYSYKNAMVITLRLFSAIGIYENPCATLILISSSMKTNPARAPKHTTPERIWPMFIVESLKTYILNNIIAYDVINIVFPNTLPSIVYPSMSKHGCVSYKKKYAINPSAAAFMNSNANSNIIYVMS